MLSEWSVECGADDPILVVPWSDPSDLSGNRRFVDLRENPYDLDHLPEAEQHPALMHALRALNGPRSPVFTAKCDAWLLDAQELAQLRFELNISSHDASAGIGGYIDILWRERAVFASFHQQEQMLHRLSRHASSLDLPNAALECIIRPALVDLVGPQEGFSVSMYIKALGHEASAAEDHWGKAIDAVVTLLRSKELAFGSREGDRRVR